MHHEPTPGGRIRPAAARPAAKGYKQGPDSAMAGDLDSYERKRDFDATPEPRGHGRKRWTPEGGGGRFVVHEHHARRLHWDLRLERDGVLASWAIPNGIPQDPDQNRKAVHVEDHPLEYLEFAGTIPDGNYGAGEISIWDAGTYELEKWRDDEVMVVLHGQRLRGRYVLFQAGKAAKDWLIHRMDPPLDPDAVEPPEHVAPMLAVTGTMPRDPERWAFEVKWDGLRAIARSLPGRLRLATRGDRDITSAYPELRGLNAALSSHDAILDGEIVAFDDAGRPSFQALQPRMGLHGQKVDRRTIERRAGGASVSYLIFDLLWLDGHPLTDRPYAERRAALEALDLDGDHWQVPPSHPGEGPALLAATAAQGLEGVVAKRLDAPYRSGRSDRWRKIKNQQRQEFVVGGYTPGTGNRGLTFGALQLGVHDEDGVLRYAGAVGTGFREQDLTALIANLREMETATSPFGGRGRTPPRGTRFVRPELVAEVRFADWTSDGSIRHSSFLGLRPDKDPAEVVRELPLADPPNEEEDRPVPPRRPAASAPSPLDLPAEGGTTITVEDRELKLTNLQKVLYPQTGTTKGQVIDYYARIAPVLLPHLHDHPVTLKRYPDGVDGKAFFSKDAVSHRPDWVATTPVPTSRKPEPNQFVLVQDLPTLVWTANLAALELHPSLSVAAPDEPGGVSGPRSLVFDLDPGAPATIVECCRVALEIRDLFAQLGLESFAKTSGSKGMQLYVPLNSGATYEETKPLAHAVARLLEQRMPDQVLSNMKRDLRPGKVFIDWSQNSETKTTVSVYALRARDRPTVSTPVSWDEVADGADADADDGPLVFTADDVLARVAERGDLFAPLLTLEQELPVLEGGN
ncbi:DNA ligase D [Patulibacter defluvii]|uniref:DNA ligase D n=1 Tax=Patulibacter defluvii TaxID=3095358 RepID=UPI002A75E1D9|nr:DNA ligase D [Patulibacter sp. DM4]